MGWPMWKKRPPGRDVRGQGALWDIRISERGSQGVQERESGDESSGIREGTRVLHLDRLPVELGAIPIEIVEPVVVPGLVLLDVNDHV